MSELNIDILCANSPQAKGRVERVIADVTDTEGNTFALRQGEQPS
jgi:hypothetical protein